MELNHKTTNLTLIDEVDVPDKFYNKMRSGIKQIDTLFGGDGILPGSTFSVAAKAGTGKTTLWLQVLSSMADLGYRTAYVTAEEALEQLAYTSRRLKADGFFAAAKNGLNDILNLVEEVDFLIIDSFQAISNDTEHKMSRRAFEKYAVGQIVRKAQDHDTTIGFILHMTKAGEYKGGTDVIHAVDMNMKIAIDPNSDERRELWTEKNRFGALASVTTYFGWSGYDFDRTVTKEEIEESKRMAGVDDAMKAVLNALEVNGPLPKTALVGETGLSEQKVQHATWKLTKQGMVESDGKRPATYSLVEREEEEEVDAVIPMAASQD